MTSTIDRIAERQFAEAQRKHSQNDVLGALRIYDALVGRGLRSPSILVYRALALVQLGRDRDARQAADLAAEQLGEGAGPAMVSERSTLGVVYRRLACPQQAERQLRLAYQAAPENAAVRNNLALVLTQMGRFAEADSLFEQAMADLPEDAAPALNRARIALYSQDFERAEAMLQAARDRQPGHADVYLIEALLALAESDHERAFRSLIRVLEKNAIHAEAWSHLANIDAASVVPEQLEKVMAALVRAKPSSAKLLALVVGIARKQLVWKHLEALESLLNQALESDSDAVIDIGSMFLLLSANVSQRAHRMAAHNGFEAFLGNGRNEPRPRPVPREGRKLRVGYLSSDLRGHAIGYLVAGVMEAHRQSETCAFYAYSNWADDGSDIRRRMRAAFTRFVNITELSDEELAARMREDGIDVLVDLNQMTAGNRVGVFCHGPAPVTVQWLGMPGTLGAGERVDYVLMDPWTAHPGNLDGFDEQPVVLAGSYQPNDSLRPDLGLGRARADWNLPQTAPVLCSFNQTQKFSPDTVALWAEIMRQVPDAVLWVLAGEPAIEERFLRIFTDAGIARERILFAERVPHDVHIARLQHADLMLDNWPYNAHTTCSDALRAGTPVLTLPGATFASRVAAGILQTANLAQWIAASPEDYVDKAVAYLSQPYAERQALKARVGETYWSSPMVDCDGFARRLEAFYLAAFERALAGQPPSPAWVGWDGDVHWGLPPAQAWRETLYDAPAAAAPKAERAAPPAEASVAAAPNPDRAASAALAPSQDRAASAASPSWQARIEHGSLSARLNNLRILAHEILGLETPPLVVDVGAAKLGQTFSWDRLAEEGLLRVLGFDPQEPRQDEPGRVQLPLAIGDGQTHTLHRCATPGMTSLLVPDLELLARYPMFARWAEVKAQEPVPTTPLDAVAEAHGARFLKIDTQGFEATILAHAERLLAEELVLLQLELSPVPLYRGEQSLFAVGAWLEARGWMLHTFANIDRRMLKSLGDDAQPYVGMKHVFQVDAVFMPHFARLASLGPQRLKALAFLAHALYGSHDVAALALAAHDADASTLLVPRYREYLQAGGVDA